MQLDIDNLPDPADFAEALMSIMAPGVAEKISRETAFHRYQSDPIGFGQEVLGEEYTDDVKRLMESVRDNEATVAISANATGKTHSAARIAAWW